MSDYWNDLAERTDGLYTADDFETAAYRLVSEQVLYHTEPRSRIAYALVDQYERDFLKILAPLGISLSVNRQLRYVSAIPMHAKSTPATVPQTLFALVLRAIYEETARAGGQTEDGEVLCDLIELGEKHRLMTGRDLPPKGEFDALMRMARRWGIARRLDGELPTGADGEGAIAGIAIRPGILDVLGEAALRRLAQWQASDQTARTYDSAGRDDTLEDTPDEAS